MCLSFPCWVWAGWGQGPNGHSALLQLADPLTDLLRGVSQQSQVGGQDLVAGRVFLGGLAQHPVEGQVSVVLILPDHGASPFV